MTFSLFAADAKDGYVPDTPPDLSRYPDDVAFDTETSGVDVWDDGVQPVGLSVSSGGDSWYLPFAHECGGNLSRDTVVSWMKRELRNKTISGVNIKFDTFMAEKMGVNLPAQGCRLQEVQFAAALLNTNRREYTLDSMGLDFLGEPKDVLDFKKDQISYAHASNIAPYAKKDAHLTARLAEKLIRS